MSETPATPELPVSQRSKLFWLRVGASVFFGLLTVALCLLWVRSYFSYTYVQFGPGGAVIQFQSARGRIMASSIGPPLIDKLNRGLELFDRPPNSVAPMNAHNVLGGWFSSRWMTSLFIPYWFLIEISGCFAATDWSLPYKRFSLRTMFIATTLVSVVLALAVWATR